MKNKKNKSNWVLNIVSSSLGGSVSMGQWLLLGLLLLSQRLLQTHTLPGVVLPVQKLLLVNELGTLSVNQLLSEVFILQELQHVQAVRVSAGNGDQRSHTFCLGWQTDSYNFWPSKFYVLLCVSAVTKSCVSKRHT